MKNKVEVKMKRSTPEHRNLVLHSMFGEAVNLGPFRLKDADRFMHAWSLLYVKKGGWWVSAAVTDEKPRATIYRMVINKGLAMSNLPVTQKAFAALLYAFNLKPIASKGMFIPDYWVVGENTVSVHSLEVTYEQMTRRHYNLITHSCSSMDTSKL